jgi:hypothetical protein
VQSTFRTTLNRPRDVHGPGGTAVESIMKAEGVRNFPAGSTNEAGQNAGPLPEEPRQRFRLVATMVQGTAATLREAWRPYASLEEARLAARAMLRNHRVLRVAIVEDRIPMQFVEWVGR